MLISVLIFIAAGTEVGLVAEPEEYGSPTRCRPLTMETGPDPDHRFACGNFRESAFD
jgi:hypothetical protein